MSNPTHPYHKSPPRPWWGVMLIDGLKLVDSRAFDVFICLHVTSESRMPGLALQWMLSRYPNTSLFIETSIEIF